MAKLTKVQAARQLGISRTTLYKLIDQGKVSATADGLIDETELVRAAPYVDTLREHVRTRVDTMDSANMDTHPSSDGHEDRVHEHVRTRGHEQPWAGVDTLVDILREQLQRAQERVYEERERAMQDHIAQLTTMQDQAHQQNQRLLDLPRGPAIPPHSPQDAPGSTQPARRPQRPPLPQEPPGDARGTMRRRIVALLQDHPEGLTPAEMRERLGVERSLADTCLGMLKYRMIERIGRGTYVATDPHNLDVRSHHAETDREARLPRPQPRTPPPAGGAPGQRGPRGR